MIKSRGLVIYALSLLALLFLAALGFSAWRDPTIRDRPLRVAPLDAWELLDFGMVRGSSLPLFWSSKGGRERTINSPEVIGKRVTWRNPFAGEWGVYVSQEIRKYRDEVAASAAYAALTAKTFDRGRDNAVAWVTPTDLDNPSHADEATLQCLGDETDFSAWEATRRAMPEANVLLPRRHCVLAARYAGLVVELRGNIFSRRWMTASRFQDVIQDMDQQTGRAALWWRELYEVKP